jgi:hypothetical protein
MSERARLINEAMNHIKDGQVAMNDGRDWMAGWHFALAMSALHEWERRGEQ